MHDIEKSNSLFRPEIHKLDNIAPTKPMRVAVLTSFSSSLFILPRPIPPQHLGMHMDRRQEAHPNRSSNRPRDLPLIHRPQTRLLRVPNPPHARHKLSHHNRILFPPKRTSCQPLNSPANPQDRVNSPSTPPPDQSPTNRKHPYSAAFYTSTSASPSGRGQLVYTHRPDPIAAGLAVRCRLFGPTGGSRRR